MEILMRWNCASITDREEWRTWAEMRRELRIRWKTESKAQFYISRYRGIYTIRKSNCEYSGAKNANEYLSRLMEGNIGRK